MKKIGLIVIFLVLLSVLVSAANVEVTAEPENYKVEAGGVAEWTLYVKNNQIRSDYYKISPDALSLAPFSDVVRNIVVEPSQVEINSLGTTEVNVKIYLLDDLVADKEYTSFVRVKSLTNPDIKEKVSLSNFIISSRELIDIRADIPEDGVIPGVNQPFDVTFKNRGNKDLDGLDIYISSNIFSAQKKLNLGAYESLKTGFSFDIESTTQSGKYSMSIRVYHGDIMRGIANYDFNVVENPNIIEEDVVDEKILKTIVRLNRENKGNKLIEFRVRYPVSFFGRLFTSTDPDAKVFKFDDGKFYYWDLSLGPGDKTNLKVVTNYRILLALILLIVICVLVFYYFKGKTVTIAKSLFRIRDETDKVTELKILLHVVNKTEKEVHNLKVIDLLPNLIKPTADFATLKPERIQKSPKGMRIIWNIPKLEKHEERVISYRVHSSLPIVGEVVLPSASVQYKARAHRVVNIKSNILSFQTKKS